MPWGGWELGRGICFAGIELIPPGSSSFKLAGTAFPACQAAIDEFNALAVAQALGDRSPRRGQPEPPGRPGRPPRQPGQPPRGPPRWWRARIQATTDCRHTADTATTTNSVDIREHMRTVCRARVLSVAINKHKQSHHYVASPPPNCR